MEGETEGLVEGTTLGLVERWKGLWRVTRLDCWKAQVWERQKGWWKGLHFMYIMSFVILAIIQEKNGFSHFLV